MIAILIPGVTEILCWGFQKFDFLGVRNSILGVWEIPWRAFLKFDVRVS